MHTTFLKISGRSSWKTGGGGAFEQKNGTTVSQADIHTLIHLNEGEAGVNVQMQEEVVKMDGKVFLLHDYLLESIASFLGLKLGKKY